MSSVNNFTLCDMHFVTLREIALDNSEQQCVLRIGFCQKHIVILLLLITKHAHSVGAFDSRFGYIIILYGCSV